MITQRDGFSRQLDSRKDFKFIFLAALVTAGCFILSSPFADLGFNDDWCYSYSALLYAKIDRTAYTGWGGVLLLFQVPYGGLLIRIFGFSFDLLRWATLPFSMGSAMLLYLLGRSVRLEPRFALFGTLTVITSPLFTPLSASFMTDIYGLFFMLACLYCGVRAVLSRRDYISALWLSVATAVGFMGGANRQIVWVAPLSVLLVFLWEKRAQRYLLLFSMGLTILLLFGIFQVMHWFQVQPNAIYEVPSPASWLRSLKHTKQMIHLTLGVALFLLPVLLYQLPSLKKIPTGYYFFLAVICAVYFFLFGEPLHLHLAPWLSNIVMPEGVLGSGQDLAGQKPIVLSVFFRSVITLVVVGVLSIWLFYLCKRLRAIWSEGFKDGWEFRARYKPFAAQILLFAIFTAGSLIASFNHPYWGFADRYLLPVLPFFGILMLSTAPNPKARFASVAGWIFLILFAVYGVATTHDYFSTSRARIQAANLLQSAGIPRQRICAGFEFDGWTQLMIAGYVREPSANPPAGTLEDQRSEWTKTPFWFLNHTPMIEPHYVVSYSSIGDLIPSEFPGISYTTWLPPFDRKLWIMKVD